jgi:PAS domain S-box-containing protein
MYKFSNLAKACLVGLVAAALVLGFEMLLHSGLPALFPWQSWITSLFSGLTGFILSLLLLGYEKEQLKLLKEQKSFADAVIRNLPAMACIFDPRGNLRLWNKNLEQKLEYSAAELARVNIQDTLAEEFREQVEQTTQKVLATGAAETEASLLTKHGGKIPCYLTGVRILVDDQPCVLGISLDISGRKQAEENLRESERQYRSLVANLPGAVWTVDRQQHVKFVSHNIEAMTGYTPAELCAQGGMVWIDHVHPLDRERVSRSCHLLFTEGKPCDLEYRLRRKDGTWFWAHSRSVSTYENAGVRYADGLLSDITERKEAEAELHRLAAIVEASQDAITSATLDGVVTSWNTGAEIIYGYAAAEALGSNIARVAPPEKQEELKELRDTVALGHSTIVETQRVRKDGTTIDISLSVAPIKDDAGNITGISGIARDITARKKADEQLRLQSAALEAAANAIVITDREGTIAWVNAAFAAITGFNKDEVRGKNPRILHSGSHDKAYYANLWSTITSGKVWSGEITNRRKDGTLYTEEMTVTPVRSGSAEITHFIAIKQDISEHKLLERQLQQAQKMEAIGRLAGGVAHDFNNMLGVITGYCELLKLRPELHVDVLRQVQEIEEAAKRAAGLTQQLLAFSRKQVLQPRILDLNEVLRKLNSLLRRLIGDDIELITHCGTSSDVRVRADQNQIEQIVMNLAVNARDAMPRGGKLIIETDVCELDESYVLSHRPVRPGRYVRLTVSDTGCGMDKETVSHLFEPFFSTKEAGTGTGLGLSIVYGIVKQSDGYIWVYSEPGQGTTFKIYLPQRSATLSPRPSELSVESLRGTETVLLAEDDAGLRKLIVRFLRDEGYVVLEADRAKVALDIAAENAHPPDVLITDIVMPGMSGRSLANNLVSVFPAMKVLYMSGYTHDGAVQTRNLNEGEAFLQKPFAPAELCKKVRELLTK